MRSDPIKILVNKKQYKYFIVHFIEASRILCIGFFLANLEFLDSLSVISETPQSDI